MSFNIVMGVVGVILFLLFFFLVWLPGFSRAGRGIDRSFPEFPPVQLK